MRRPKSTDHQGLLSYWVSVQEPCIKSLKIIRVWVQKDESTGPTHAKQLERAVPRSRLASHELNILLKANNGQQASGVGDKRFFSF